MCDREGHSVVYVPMLEDAEAETKAVLDHACMLTRALKEQIGEQAATAPDDAISDLMAAFQAETMTHLISMLQQVTGVPAHVFVRAETPRRHSRLTS
jgi:hypothetical protein